MQYIRVNGGVKIAVQQYNPSGSRPVLMLHGWPLNQNIFEYQLEPLLSAGHRVITMDFRGFGRSDVTCDGYSYNQLAGDLYQVVHALGLYRFTLAGHSMGGAVALRYMRRFHGYGVKRLALLAAVPCLTQREGYPYGVAKEVADRWLSLAATDRPQLCESISKAMFAAPHSKAMIRSMEQIALSASGVGTLRAGRSMEEEDCRPDLEAVQVPTAIFHGKEDRVTPFDLAEYTQSQIKDSALYPLEHSGHGLFCDEPELFHQQFLPFLTNG
ncbi:MAG: alpha/beta hydrolase [Clostridiales bacterium]|jgi:non-heme chloroperoxidase|nr:alpha/beta hydrolase [Clostridiales bacterium]